MKFPAPIFDVIRGVDGQAFKYLAEQDILEDAGLNKLHIKVGNHFLRMRLAQLNRFLLALHIWPWRPTSSVRAAFFWQL